MGAGNGNSHDDPKADMRVEVVEEGVEAAWHALPIEQVLRDLETSEAGLSEAEATERLQLYGPNALTPPQKPGFLKKLWVQVNNILIWILVAAVIVSAALRSWADMALIGGVVIINVALGMFQEGKAENAAEAIKAMLSASANVVRGGERRQVEADQLVPGDVVVIKSGDKIPADMRVIQASNLQVMEAPLTGESVPISKNLEAVAEVCGLGDRRCMLYSATNVSAGQGLGVVVATGDSAEIGKISKMVSKVVNVKTNLIIQLEILGRWLAITVSVLGLASFFLARFRAGESWAQAFSSAVAIAVAIVPAGLPSLVTIVLAIGTTVMARNNAIIRSLPCVETLGSLNVICSDKTGTLTKNEMTGVAVRTAEHLYRVKGVGYAPTGDLTDDAGTPLEDARKSAVAALLEGAVLCNDSALTQETKENGREDWVPNGAPTEVALLTLGAKAGLEAKALKAAQPRLLSVPFESEHKFMACVVAGRGGERVMYVKGAPDRVIPMCTTQVTGDDFSAPLAPLDEPFWSRAQADLSSQGLRVLALCRQVLPEKEQLVEMKATDLLARPPALSLVALVAILDPPREEAIAAVKIAHKAGISVKMITGDHSLTALAIGKMLGIQGDCSVYTGPQVDAMDDKALEDVVLGCNIWARASPENKLRIVRALQAKRQVAAMTGDGVNDAPALKAADIGVAMGITGTDVSREAAKMVLADDNFASIVAAVREGRRVWDNLRKILLFNLPVNFAQGMSVMWAYIVGFPEAPLTAKQVLYINLITAVTLGMMLAAEPPESTVMDHPPRRPGKRLLGKVVLWRTTFVCTVMVCVILGFYAWGGALGEPLCQRRAEAFNVLVFMEIAYSISCRYIKQTALQKKTITENPLCYASIVLTVALQFLMTYTPGLNAFFDMCAMDGWAWLRTVVAMFGMFVLIEVEKALIDPLLMPIVRKVINAGHAMLPRFLKEEGLEEEEADKRAHDHCAVHHTYSTRHLGVHITPEGNPLYGGGYRRTSIESRASFNSQGTATSGGGHNPHRRHSCPPTMPGAMRNTKSFEAV